MKHWLAQHFSVWGLVAIPLCGCSCELWLMLHRAQVPVARVGYALDYWFDWWTTQSLRSSRLTRSLQFHRIEQSKSPAPVPGSFQFQNADYFVIE
jgi:hypothetical protein